MPLPSRLLLLALTYLISAEIGHLLSVKPGNFATFWPPGGVLLAVLLTSPRQRWLAFLSAAALANFVSDSLIHQQPLTVSMGFVVANLSEALGTALLLQRWCAPSISFESLRHVLHWSAVIVFITTPLSALVGALIVKTAFGSDFLRSWYVWWVSDLLGLLIITPLVYSFLTWKKTLATRHLLEATSLILSLSIVTVGMFRLPYVLAIPPAVLFVFLLWAALRFDSIGVAGASLVLVVISIGYSKAGLGPFSLIPDPLARVLMAQMLCVTGTLLFYILSAVMAERRVAERELQQANANLDQQVQARTEELVTANQQLRASEERLELAVNATQLGIWDSNLLTHEFYGSAYLRQIYGLTPEAPLSPELIVSLIHPEDLPRWRQIMHTVLNPAGDGQLCFEHRFIRNDHEVRWGIVNGYAEFAELDGKRQVVRLTGSTLDITARKEAEAQLRESREQLRLALEASFTIAFTWDIQRNIVRRYHSDDPVLSATDEQHTDTFENVVSFVYPPDQELFRRAVQAALEDPKGIYQAEYRIQHPNGDLLWYAERGQVEFARDGTAVRLIGLSMDITERKTMELERERLLQREQAARQLAEEANRAKDDWLAMVSHELRTPLNAILGHARLLNLRRSQLTPDFAEFADLVRRNGERQNEIINDLLDTARMTTGKLRLEIAPLELSAVIADALNAVQPSAQVKSLTLKTQLAPAASALVGDATRLHQVVLNLLTNAVKFTPAGGSIEICLQREAQHAVLTISDTGCGIEPEFLPNIFERFSQADTSRSRRYGGLGLGLALVKQIVELHGGTITADSSGAGQGASFTITLPLQASKVEEPDHQDNEVQQVKVALVASTEASAFQFSVSGASVLVVEDDPDACELLSSLLKSEGARVQLATTAAAAWEAMTSVGQPDILICDIGLPDEDGYSLMRRLRQWEKAVIRQELPALALTAYGGMSDRLNALQAGFQMHVAKPIEPVELLAVIQSLLDRARLIIPASGK